MKYVDKFFSDFCHFFDRIGQFNVLTCKKNQLKTFLFAFSLKKIDFIPICRFQLYFKITDCRLFKAEKRLSEPKKLVLRQLGMLNLPN